MITKQYEVTIAATRSATTKVRLIIEATDERAAELALDRVYDTINELRNIGAALVAITANDALVAMPHKEQ